MKRQGNFFDRIISRENILEAHSKAKRGKSDRKDVIAFEANMESYILAIQKVLSDQTYKVPAYYTFSIYEPKKRDVCQLPYQDHLIQHMIMNVVGYVFYNMLTADTFSCIEGRGIHGALKALKKALRDTDGTKYCLKIDIRKFYPSIDHNVLKSQLRRKFKDQKLLWLFDLFIDSSDGLPIGNYLSLPLANFHLTPFDHWIKEVIGCKYYLRYLDDMVLLSGSKEYLHGVLAEIKRYLRDNLHLELKDNYQIFPVESRGIDFVGYVSYHTHIKLRKSIKKNFARKIAKGANAASIASYRGWTNHADCKHLIKMLLNESVQRLGNKTSNQRNDRRQNQDIKSVQQNDQSAGFPDN